MFTGLTDFSAEERALLERFIDQTYQAFLEKVASGRGMSVEAVQEIAQGRVWTGSAAQEIGLVDALGGLETAIEKAAASAGLAEGTYRIRTLPRPKTFLERFNEALTTQAATAWQHLTLSPFERNVIEQQRVLRDFVRDHGTAQARLPFAIDMK